MASPETVENGNVENVTGKFVLFAYNLPMVITW